MKPSKNNLIISMSGDNENMLDLRAIDPEHHTHKSKHKNNKDEDFLGKKISLETINNDFPKKRKWGYPLFVAISVGLFFASILFYFQVVQPRVVKAILADYTGSTSVYTDSKNAINLIKSSTDNYRQGLQKYYQSISEDVCTPRTNREVLSTEKKTVQNYALLNVKDTWLQNSNIYGIQDTTLNEYKSTIISKYKDVNAKLNIFVDKLVETQSILETMDTLRTECDKLEKINTNGLASVEGECTVISTAIAPITNTTQSTIGSRVNSSIKSLLKLCSTQQQPDFANFKQEFQKYFDKLFSEDPDLDNLGNELKFTVQKSIEEIENIKFQMENSYNERLEFKNSWYILR
jgi:hypothetical protein